MKNFSPLKSLKSNWFVQNFSQSALLIIAITIAFLLKSHSIKSQGIIPTKGTDFWVGFPYAPYEISGNAASKRCDIFITSDVNTSGVVSIPQQGWTQNFTVTANVTTTVTIPVLIAENTTSEVVENKGIQVTTNDTVSVFAISFMTVSADGTVVYPKQSLGTQYRIGSYPGINYSGAPLHSNFQVVATEDGTQIRITPTAPTLNGKPANVPFLVSLDAGESYQVIADTYTDDFTGTTIEATDSSGSCRPFSVFSGSVCVNIPNGCYACDVLYDQAIPVPNWGKTYYAVPFSFATNYTVRILADQNATTYSVNGMPGFLNAGQFIETNNITGTQCITSNKPISVIQYMQGITCSGAGDPSMMYLNAQEQKIDKVTFSTVTSAVITQHNVNVIMSTSHISQLKLDGNPVPAASFSPMASCNNISFAQLSITQGSHTLEADSGFTAYIYGTGQAESYAYSVGSFSKAQPILVDSILCTNDTIHIGTTGLLYGCWWSTSTNPNDTIATTPVLTLVPPIVPDVYIEHGSEFISGCEKTFYFNVEVPDPPQTWVTQTADTACQTQLIQLYAGTNPASSVYQYTWTPVAGLDNPNIPNPVATATTSMWYHVAISSPNGCSPTVYDSIYIYVIPLPLPNASAGGNQSICNGASATLSATGGVSYLWNPGFISGSSITVTPTSTTSYVVFVTDSNGCGNSDTVMVTVNAVPNANAGIDKIVCAGGSTTLTATGGGTYLWSTGSTNASISVSPSTSTYYVVTVTSANGCTKSDSALVTVNTLPLASAGTDQTICIGTSASLTATGGTSYLWSTGAVTPSISVSPLVATNYSVIVTDANGCQKIDTVRVNVNPIPTANAGLNQTICAGSSATLTATGGVFYAWNPTGSTSNTITVSPLANASYVVTVSDSAGCSNTDTVLVSINPLPVANAGTNVSICAGASTTLSANPAGASYLWTPGGSTSSSPSVTPAATTTYMLQVTDANGCKDTDSVLVTVNPLPVANAGLNQTICFGASAILTATGGISYVWSTGSVTASVIVSPFVATNYTVTVTDFNGCQKSDVVLVNVNPLPAANAGLNQTICAGSSATLTATGGVLYAWNPTGITSNTITVSPTGSTAYIVNVTDANGCSKADTVLVTVNSLPVANAGTNVVICNGSSTTLAATPIGLSYLWTPGGSISPTLTVSPVVTTTYQLQVTDANGCKDTDSVKVTVNSLPVAVAGPDQTICSGFQTSLSATGGASYLWSPGGATTASISVSPSVATSYVVQVTDTNGCKNYDTVQVAIDPFLSGSATNQAICIGSSTTLVATGGGSYSWIPGGSINDSIIVSPLNTATYMVHIITPIGCLIYDTITVNVNPLPVANAGTDKAVCIGLNTTLAATGGVSYLWTPTGLTTASITVSPVANQSYIVQVTDANGCKNTDTVLVTVNALPVAVGGTDQSICPGQTATLSASGGTSYIWYPGGIASAAISVSPLVSTTYVVQVTDGNGCKNRDTVLILIDPLPVSNFTVATSPVCESSTISFVNASTVSSGTIVYQQWNFGDGLSATTTNAMHSFNNTGNFTVALIVTTDKGCMDTSTIPVTINANPYVDFTTQNNCVWQPVEFTDQSTVSLNTLSGWHWDFGDGTVDNAQNPEHIYSQAGLYTIQLTVTSDSGCSTTKTKEQSVEIYPLPDANFMAAPENVSIFNPLVHFIDLSTGNVTLWNWNFGDDKGFSEQQSPYYTYADTGTFTVQMIATTTDGCLDTTYGEVFVIPDLTIYFPNAFTPNSDGKNDFFTPVGMGIGNFDLRIFNRWGNEVFYSNSISKSWDGSFGSSQQPCSEGVYVFTAKVTNHLNVKHEFTGRVTLIR